MPKVGDKEFAYTPEGIAAAKQESAESNIPVSDGATRNVTKYAGGGETGFNRIGVNPKININQGSNIEGYNPGGGDRFTLDPDVMDAAEAYYEKGGRVVESAFDRNKRDSKSNVDPGQYKAGKKGFLTKEGKKQKRIDTLASKRDSAPKGSLKRRMLQNRINRLSGSKVKHTAKSEKTKAKTEASWKGATAKHKEASPTSSSLSELIKARDKYVSEGNKGSTGYKSVQNRINKAYNVKKRHK